MIKFFRWVVPVALIGVALIGINLGLDRWLAPGTGLLPPTLPFTARFDDASLANWQTHGGDWQTSAGQLSQQHPGQEYLAIYAPIKLLPEQAYRVRATVALPSKSAAGVLFNVVYPLFQARSQFVVIHNDDGKLSASGGYFLDGSTYSQREAPIADAATIDLTVLVDPVGYTMYANGQLIAQDVPLFYQGGGVGLSAYGSGMLFDSLTVDSGQTGQPVTLAPTVKHTQLPTTAAQTNPTITPPAPLLLGQFTTINGTWTQVGNLVNQTATVPLDYAASTLFSGERYTLAALVISNAGQQVGGGFIFNMLDRTEIIGANAVRLINSGRVVEWGYFSIGQFVRQGQAATNLAGTAPPTLKVTVGNGTYSVAVNNEPVAAGIPLLNLSGSVGLTTFGGPVSFSNINLSLGG